jgi:hypothetical protein
VSSVAFPCLWPESNNLQRVCLQLTICTVTYGLLPPGNRRPQAAVWACNAPISLAESITIV